MAPKYNSDLNYVHIGWQHQKDFSVHIRTMRDIIKVLFIHQLMHK
jgi:hypothetical protein